MIRSFLTRTLIVCSFAAGALPGTAAAKPGDVARSIASPAKTPTGLAFDGRSLWVADRRTATIYEVDPASGAVRSRMPTPGWSPEGLVWDGTALWAADGAAQKVYRIDPRRRLVLRSLPSPGRAPNGLAWDGKALWVADRSLGKVVAISTTDGAVLRSMPLPRPDAQGLGLAWDGRHLWVGDRIHDRIYLCDPEHDAVLFHVPAPGPHVQGLAYDAKARRLWAVDYQTDTIYHLLADDGTLKAPFGTKEQVLDFVQPVRNLGPDALRDVAPVVAVPSSRENQEVLSITYEGPPHTFVTDRQGQKLARFTLPRLEAGKSMTATMHVRVRLHGVQWYIFPEKVGRLGEIPADVKRRYLADDPKYQLKDAFLRRSVKEALGGERNPYWMARKLARYIDDHMRYELAGQHESAPIVLRRGTGSCSEYTFVFVAMCRAAGLPARWVGAVVVRKDDGAWDDVFHRWPEIYLPRHGWVPFDVQHADQPTPAGHADGFGLLGANVLVTTVSGGFSDYLDWSYNSNATWACEGRCEVQADPVGEWTPAPQATKAFTPPPLPAPGRSPR